MERPRTINVLVERHGDLWFAQFLEIDLATQARSLQALREEIPRILAAHLASCEERGADPFARKAPDNYWLRYQSAGVPAELIARDREISGLRMRQPQIEARFL